MRNERASTTDKGQVGPVDIRDKGVDISWGGRVRGGRYEREGGGIRERRGRYKREGESVRYKRGDR